MSENLYNATIDEIIQGYTLRHQQYTCLFCGEVYQQGEIYQKDGHFYDAQTMILQHIKEAHGSSLQTLLSLNSDLLGVSDAQKRIMQGFAEGKSDKEIASEKQLSPSTIRNYRFKLREKERQAKLFLAIMQLLKVNASSSLNIQDPHLSATMIDDRYHITEEERIKVLNTYMTKEGALKELPSKEKRKLIILKEIANQFKKDTHYTETQINRILKRIYQDYPYLRRLLVEYGFLDRTADGRKYWRS